MAKKYLDLVGLQAYHGKITSLVSDSIESAVQALDTASDVSIASEANGVVTLKAGIKEVDGVIAQGTGADIVLAKVSTTGASADVGYSNTIDGTAVTNVDDALDALVEASAGGVASKTIWLNPNESVTTGYLKTYGIYQGANSYDAETNPATLVGKIDIPRDLVVTSGQIVVNPEGLPAGTYLELTIANQDEPVYINVADLCDVYTAEASAAQVQLAISATNEISATIVAGSVGTTELADGAVTAAKLDANAVTTAKIADDAVTADKVAITAHTEAQTAGADGLAISVTTTDGQVSAVSGSIAANTYDSYGSASAAQTAAQGYADGLIGDLDATVSQTAGTDGLALSITETDGVITALSGSIAANTYEAYGTSASAIAALDASVTQDAQEAGAETGLALSLTEVDGVVTALSGSIATITNTEINALFE